MKTEVRFVTAAPGREVRMEPAAGGQPAKISGYAAVYNSLSEDLGGFRERVLPGAFSAALAAQPDVRARYNHDALLGRTKAGTLRLLDDPVGLRYEIDAPDTSVGRDVCESIRRGDVDGSSFCFRLAGTAGGAGGDAFIKDAGGPIRELRQLELLDVGPVDSPAYRATEGLVGVRALPDASKAELTKLLVPAGTGLGRPNLWAARLKLAESGEARFYVSDDTAAAALVDACLQAGSACDSLISLTWKMPDDAAAGCRAVCLDARLLCQALGQVATAPGSAIAADLAGITGAALRDCAKSCKGLDHPISKLCAAVALQTADQCDTLAGE